jgi:predicted ATPase/DNA-binding SARP family transcriptional activator/tetratricopeptide (TPR) repeat protein
MLGGVEVAGPEGPVALGPAARVLLAVLLVRRHEVVPLDSLTEALWRDDPPPTARATLQTHLSKLRRSVQELPGARLELRPPGYLLEADRASIDADRFEDLLAAGRALDGVDPQTALDRLTSALACWHGPALAEFAEEPWAQAEAVRLTELRLVAAEERAELLLAADHHAELVPELEALVSANPLRERSRGQLMVALHRSGRQAEALRSAQELRRHLGEQLGLEPSAGLRQLEQAIAVDDPTLLRPSPIAVRTAAAATDPTARSVPNAPTRLVGRADDLDHLVAAMGTTGLLTLVGPGGVGKTRLAFELARVVNTDLVDLVRIVELAPVTLGEDVEAAVAAALGVERRPGRSLVESIVELLAPQRVLLVVDNCEHVLGAVGRLIGEVLRWCPDVRVLTTSREALGMPGEVVWGVTPLALPTDPGAPLAELQASPAVQVFVSRATAASPGFSLGDRNAPAVAELCAQLDGVPLALELAAARMGSMSPGQLVERLHDRFALLSQGPAVEPRHRTLHDLVQWSFELLSPPEQILLARLSVFAGGFDLEAVEHTCADDRLPSGRILPLLAALVDKSLVVADTNDDVVRYRQLETIRQFGAEQLDSRPGGSGVRQAHRRTFTALAEEAGAGLDGPDEAMWSARLDREMDNLRAAVRTAVTDGDADTGLRVVVAARELSFRRMRYELVRWAGEVTDLPQAQGHPLLPTALAVVAYGSFVRGELRKAVEQAERSLGAAVRLDLRSSGLAERTLGNALFYQGDHDAALRWMERMVETARAGGIDGRIAHGLYMRSVARTSLGDTPGGEELAAEAMCAARSAGSPTALSQATYAAGLACSSAGSPASVREGLALLDESRDLATSAGNRWMRAFALTESMWLRARLGETGDALAGYREVVETWYQSGDWANQWLSLRQLAGILASVGRDEDAALLFGAVTAAGARTALPFAPTDAEDLEELSRELEQRLGPETLAAHRRRGGMMRDESVVATALAAIDDLL